MNIKTHEIDNHKGTYNFKCTKDASHLVKEIRELVSISEVDVAGTIEKLAGMYYVNGTVSAVMTLKCSRCLKEFDYRFESEFKESFVHNDMGLELEEEDEVSFIDADEIDLSEIVEEAVSLMVPYVPLCTEDCKGLCPSCGIDLNKGSCSCNNERIDPRLADLAKWFDKE